MLNHNEKAEIDDFQLFIIMSQNFNYSNLFLHQTIFILFSIRWKCFRPTLFYEKNNIISYYYNYNINITINNIIY